MPKLGDGNELHDTLRMMTAGIPSVGDTIGRGRLVSIHVVTGSGWHNLTTSYTAIPDCTLTVTPTVNELVIVQFNYRLYCNGGTAPCNANDNTRCRLYLNGSGLGYVELAAPGAIGEFWGSLAESFSLIAGTAYTIDLRAVNLSGNRGQATGSFSLMRFVA